MFNSIYINVKSNANLINCNKCNFNNNIDDNVIYLRKDNYLGEFRTELERKIVLNNLGLITDIESLWEYIN